MISYIEHPGPLGPMLLAANDAGLCGVYFEPHSHFSGSAGWQKLEYDPAAAATSHEAESGAKFGAAAGQDAAPARVQARRALLQETARQLDQYFARQRQSFDLPLAAQGTPFQCEVWQGLCRIPYGETWHYAQLAHEIARPRAVRAVGAANGRNPLSIIVPCHRVIGRDGTLTGYAGGLERKQFLLALEHPEQHTLFK